jgi:hypothetical protein
MCNSSCPGLAKDLAEIWRGESKFYTTAYGLALSTASAELILHLIVPHLTSARRRTHCHLSLIQIAG